MHVITVNLSRTIKDTLLRRDTPNVMPNAIGGQRTAPACFAMSAIFVCTASQWSYMSQ